VGRAVIATRPIGTTGLNLSRIGFGGAPLGDLKRAPSNDEAAKLLQQAWDAGIRYFDTAPMYGNGLSERRIGDFLRDKPRDSYVLSSKVGRLLVPDRLHALERSSGDMRAMPFRCVFDFSYDAIMRSHEQSLQRLGLERVDILYLHDLGRFSQGANHDKTWADALDGGIRALVKLREEGSVKAIGAGVNEWQVLDALMNHARWDVFLLANRYTLLDQQVLDHFLPRCIKEGIAIVDGAPLNAGILATGAIAGAMYDYKPASPAILKRVRAIETICKDHGVPLTAVALNFPLGHQSVASIIPGFARSSDLESNLGYFQHAIPDVLWADLREAGLLHPAAPVPPTPALS
jgi:D-threo-aldose 1-dehydrogenase